MVADVDEHARLEMELTPWVRQHVVFPDRDLHGSCYKLILRHLNVNRENQGDVDSMRLTSEAEGEERIGPVLRWISSRSQQDADDVNQGVQTYAVYAYYDRDKNYSVRKLFRVAPSGDAEMDRQINPSEPASERGLAAQAMRHVEVLMRQTTVVTGMQLQSAQREIQRLSEMNERFSQQQIDFMVLMQETMNDATRRRLEEKKEEASLALKEEAMAKLSALLPVIVNRLAGSKVLPEEDPSFMLVASLLENMSDEQQEKFFGMLSEAQRITLAEIVSQYEQKKSRVARGGMIVGKKNAVPSPGAPATAMVKSGEPTLEMQVRDRLTADANQTSDPVLQRIEQHGNSFSSRFADFFKKPSTP